MTESRTDTGAVLPAPALRVTGLRRRLRGTNLPRGGCLDRRAHRDVLVPVLEWVRALRGQCHGQHRVFDDDRFAGPCDPNAGRLRDWQHVWLAVPPPRVRQAVEHGPVTFSPFGGLGKNAAEAQEVVGARRDLDPRATGRARLAAYDQRAHHGIGPRSITRPTTVGWFALRKPRPTRSKSERLIRDNPFPPWGLRLAGSSFPQLKHSEGGRNREECWQNCEENCDIGEKNGAMDGQWLIR